MVSIFRICFDYLIWEKSIKNRMQVLGVKFVYFISDDKDF